MNMRTKDIAYIAMFVALSLALYILEGMIPVLIPIPGAKLGISNIVIMFLIYKRKRLYAIITLLMKVVLSALIAGQIVSFMFSLVGGLFSLLIMLILVIMFGYKGEVACGIFAAVSHNLGQFLVAVSILGLDGMKYYLPYLVILGIGTGVFTGLVTMFLNKSSQLNFR